MLVWYVPFLSQIVEKRQFKSNLKILQISYAAWCLLEKNTNLFSESRWPVFALLLDFIINWGSLLLAITFYSSEPALLLSLILVPAIAYTIVFKKKPIISSGRQSLKHDQDNKEQLLISGYLPKKGFVTAYRGAMMIITCLAILAVDFRIFPRRFASVESWGTSLMDLGVGSFVFSMGVVSARPVLVNKAKGVETTILSSFSKSFTSSLTLVAHGIARVILSDLFNYKQEVTQYGVHWNIFFTLALIGPLTSLLVGIQKRVSRSVTALIISIAYELALTKLDLISFILEAPRTNFFTENREGIFSTIGYVSVFLVGQSTGLHLLPNRKPKFDKNNKPTDNLVFYITTRTFFYGALYLIASYFYPFDVSRRLTNLPYTLWVCFFNTAFLSAYVLIERFFFGVNKVEYDKSVPLTLDVVNANSTVVFLLAYILTGVIDLNIDTFKVGDIQALLILIIYSMLLLGTAALLSLKTTQVKSL